MKRLLAPTILGALFALPATAQVPPGHSVEFLIEYQPSWMDIIDVPGTGALAPVTGYPPQIPGMNTGVIDPVTGDIWATGRDDSSKYLIFKMTLAGTTVTNFTVVADLSSLPMGPDFPGGLAGMDFDQDGNLFACDGTYIWRIDRQTFAVTEWADSIPGVINGLTIDRATNTMWSTSLASVSDPMPASEVRTFDINAGPGPGTQLMDALAAGLPSAASAITHDGNGTIYVGCFGTSTGLYSVDAATGIPQSLPISGINGEFNSMCFDRLTGLLHTGGGSFGPSVYSLIDVATQSGTTINSDHQCFPTPQNNFCFTDSANIAAVDVNDYLHETQLFPRTASKSAGLQLEVAAQGQPGEVAVIALTAIGGNSIPPILLGGGGVCGLGGNHIFDASIAPGTLNPALSSLSFATATLDGGTGTFILGGEVTLTLQP